MLVRSAGRKQHRYSTRALAASFAQLNLPWLAPAQLRWSASQPLQTERRPASARRRDPSRERRVREQQRQLATATGAASITGHSPFDSAYVPPHGGKNDIQHFPFALETNPPSRLSNLRPYDDPVIVNKSLQTPSVMVKVQNGVWGTTADLLQHLHTSLRVGRVNRAEAIISRLSEQCMPTSPELRHAHVAYLEESLRVLAAHGRGSDRATEIMKSMNKWFEVEMRRKGVIPDDKVLIVMIRAAIRSQPDEKKRDRSIRRFAELAKELGPDTYDDVLYSEEYDDNEFTILGRATSELPTEATLDETEQAESLQSPSESAADERIDMDTVPEVLSTPQRGEGLTSIKRAIEGFRVLPPLPEDATPEAQYQRALERQRIMEETSVEVAIDRWRKEDEELRKIGINTAMQSRPLGALMWQWYRKLLPALESELKEVARVLRTPMRNASDDRHYYGPYLELLPLEKVAATTILHITNMISGGKNHTTKLYENEAKLTSLCTTLSSIIEDECNALTKKARQKGKPRKANAASKMKWHARAQDRAKAHAEAATQAESHKSSKTDMLTQLDWPGDVKVKFGAMLVQKLIDTAQLPVTRTNPRTQAQVTQMQPAFLHRLQWSKGKRIGMISANPALLEKIQNEPVGSLIAKRMPMIVEPKPWSGFSEGGYLHYSTPILRLTVGEKSARDYFNAAHERGDTTQLYAGLNALGKLPWKVQHDVFKVQLEAWNSGEAIANLAPLNPEFDIPQEPDPSSGPTPRRKWLVEMRDIENKKTGLHSKRCFQNFQLELARALLNETLYFPHSMDFRGRAYPVPPYLNHMGADNVRGLLVFAEGKELGHDGLRWLKIHLANVAGYDKASLQEREDYTMAHLEDIYDSVKNPLGGRRWWLKSEDAWQTLSACFELTKALDSPDPEKFVSHLPIQQDGTCNGLQHYAALGGDEAGAAQVNLEPGDRPADVYSAVMRAVNNEIEADVKLGNPTAKKLQGRLTRKCVKQPVMTNVYGVTFYGAKEQVQRQLLELFPEVKRSDEISHGHMAQYVATKIFKSLGTMFRGAQDIQYWLGQCADRISMSLTAEQVKQLTSKENEIDELSTKRGRGYDKRTLKRRSKQIKDEIEVANASQDGSTKAGRLHDRKVKALFRSTVVWTTPLRLPVVQPYRVSRPRLLDTSLQRVSLVEPRAWDPVSKRKQLQAFPPNFIHSLDASHMLLSALKCTEIGMSFAMIHDSFWTHAKDVRALGTVLRDAFVAMHSDNIIGRLKEEFETRYQGCMHLAAMYSHSEVGEKVTAWRKEKHRSGGGVGDEGELALEWKRHQLLQSKDPAEQQRGREMVTPGSIVDDAADESMFLPPAELVAQKLGLIPDEAADQDMTEGVEEEALGSTLSEDRTMFADAEAVTDEDPAEDVGEVGVEEPAQPTTKAKTKTKKAHRYPRKLHVWLPLRFPDMPKKGSFDVTRLRQSEYFFH